MIKLMPVSLQHSLQHSQFFIRVATPNFAKRIKPGAKSVKKKGRGLRFRVIPIVQGYRNTQHKMRNSSTSSASSSVIASFFFFKKNHVKKREKRHSHLTNDQEVQVVTQSLNVFRFELEP